jgi:peptide-methionine (S)-S-oxide reductase
MTKKIVLAGGLFWTTEAIFRRFSGIVRTSCGYAGGTSDDPSYEAVSTGRTGHAECVMIEYNPAQTNLELILEAFWLSIDPTTLDRQGADIGSQYRSGIFYIDPMDLPTIVKSVNDAQLKFKDPIVTEIKHIEEAHYYRADEHHQDYYSKNKEKVYCLAIIKPKIEKIEKVFGIRKTNMLS